MEPTIPVESGVKQTLVQPSAGLPQLEKNEQFLTPQQAEEKRKKLPKGVTLEPILPISLPHTDSPLEESPGGKRRRAVPQRYVEDAPVKVEKKPATKPRPAQPAGTAKPSSSHKRQRKPPAGMDDYIQDPKRLKPALDESIVTPKTASFKKKGASSITPAKLDKPVVGMSRSEILRRCRQVIIFLMKEKSMYGFSAPVDELYDMTKVIGYDNIVKRKMDLRTIRNNIDKRAYEGNEDFAADGRLVFQNSMAYNLPVTQLHQDAKAGLELFEQKLKEFVLDPMAQAQAVAMAQQIYVQQHLSEGRKARAQAARSSNVHKNLKQSLDRLVPPTIGSEYEEIEEIEEMPSEEEDTESVSDVKKELRQMGSMVKALKNQISQLTQVNVQLAHAQVGAMQQQQTMIEQQTAAVAAASAPPPRQPTPPPPAPRSAQKGRRGGKPKSKPRSKGPMNYEDKKALSLNINRLPADKLGRVVDIIQRHMGNVGSGDEEIEIDIDQLDTTTLRALEDYVDNVLKQRRSSNTSDKRKLTSAKRAKPRQNPVEDYYSSKPAEDFEVDIAGPYEQPSATVAAEVALATEPTHHTTTAPDVETRDDSILQNATTPAQPFATDNMAPEPAEVSAAMAPESTGVTETMTSDPTGMIDGTAGMTTWNFDEKQITEKATHQPTQGAAWSEFVQQDREQKQRMKAREEVEEQERKEREEREEKRRITEERLIRERKEEASRLEAEKMAQIEREKKQREEERERARQELSHGVIDSSLLAQRFDAGLAGEFERNELNGA